jgi:hypothetical protein
MRTVLLALAALVALNVLAPAHAAAPAESSGNKSNWMAGGGG